MERDLPAIQELLRLCGLPIDDCAEQIDGFFLAELGEKLVAVGGLEIQGEEGLIRSIAVAPGARKRGLGKTICVELQGRAAEAGVRRLFLLTETAERFFHRLGYRSVSRLETPRAIQATRQFVALCPSSAQVMFLEIEPTSSKEAP